MVDRHPEHRFVLVVDSHTAHQCSFPAGAEAMVVDTATQPTRAAAADSSRSLRDVWRMSSALARAGCDVLLFPTRYTFVPVLRRTPVVLTIHDATDAKHPELLFPTWRSRLLWRMKSRLAIRSANRIVTVSYDARRQIAAAFGLTESESPSSAKGRTYAFIPRPARRWRTFARAICCHNTRTSCSTSGASVHTRTCRRFCARARCCAPARDGIWFSWATTRAIAS